MNNNSMFILITIRRVVLPERCAGRAWRDPRRGNPQVMVLYKIYLYIYIYIYIERERDIHTCICV